MATKIGVQNSSYIPKHEFRREAALRQNINSGEEDTIRAVEQFRSGLIDYQVRVSGVQTDTGFSPSDPSSLQAISKLQRHIQT